MRLTSSSKPLVGLPRLFVCALLGLGVGAGIAWGFNSLPLRGRTHLVPAPYRLGKAADTTVLRMAMVHDVLHERYLRHGQAWYEARIAQARSILSRHVSENTSNSDDALAAMDDLAVALDRTGNDPEAIRVMRQKLTLLPASPPMPEPPPRSAPLKEGLSLHDIERREIERARAAELLSPIQRQQYTTCANLGTVLVHGAMRSAMKGDAAARSQVEEGLQWIRRSVAINPAAHFGRERWQAIAIEHFLAAIDHPDLLLKYSLIGEDLTQNISDDFSSAVSSRSLMFMPTDLETASDEVRARVRRLLPQVGIEADWAAIVQPEYVVPMPFDEPALGLIGMWTLGGGANPHFAMTLGRIMESVGQFELAWNGYERAIEMKDQFWPEASTRDAMAAWCRARQAAIAKREAPSTPDQWQERMRQQHAAELTWGKSYQTAYQDYEAAQIKAGKSIDDPNFYDAFFAGRKSIASSPGLADDFIVTDLKARSIDDVLPLAVLGTGVGLALGLVTERRAPRTPIMI